MIKSFSYVAIEAYLQFPSSVAIKGNPNNLTWTCMQHLLCTGINLYALLYNDSRNIHNIPTR